MSTITQEFALKLLEKNGTPNHVIRHCMAVASIGVILSEELNKFGFDLSVEVIGGAAMLHDIARVEEEHGEIGAGIVASHGFFNEAEIIKEHMHYPITDKMDNLKEIDIVCLADRMVKEDQYVGLEERMAYILAKWKGDPKAEEKIRKRIVGQLILLKEIETLMGISIDDLIDKKGNKT